MELAHTNPKLLEALNQASKRKLTPAEAVAQKVSYVYGSMKPGSAMTRDRIREILAEQERGVISRAVG